MATAAPTLSSEFSADHRRCDALLADLESDIDTEAWEQADRAWSRLRSAIDSHLLIEESDLFPALERAGTSEGPIAVMRLEHAEMRDLMVDLDRALSRRATDECAGIIETLLILTQQHNLKEEGILYATADEQLDAATCAAIRTALHR